MTNKYPPTISGIWDGIKTRVFNKNRKDYKRYGGRGITLCDRWLLYDNFAEDMLPTYVKGLTIERIDNNKGYSKENCRWATRQEQNLNTRNVERAMRVSFNGVSKTIREWALEIGIKKRTLYNRLFLFNWSVEEALLKGRDNYD